MGGDATVESSQPLPVRRWVHLATVYDAPKKEVRLYVGGELNQTLRISAFPIRPTPGQDLYLGRYGGQDSNQFDGMIDELRITADALDYTGPPTQPYSGEEPGTVGLYHFDSIGPTFVVKNTADPLHMHIKVLGGGDSLLVDTVPGFGRAFDMSTHTE